MKDHFQQSEAYRRSTNENQLNRLSLINIHYDIEVSVKEIIEDMARTNRRIRLR